MNPLIVMGMGRSGTRFFSDVLSCHESILLNGEIPHSVMRQFFRILELLDAEYDRADSRKKKWLDKKKKFIFESFGYMSMGVKLEKRSAIYCGHKTPRSEIFFEQYEHHFGSVGERPYYFYCVRDPVRVWSSYKNMPWNSFKSVDEFISAYEKSCSQYEKASRKARGRVFLLNLDSYIEAENKEKFIEKNLLRPINLPSSQDYFERVFSVKNTNSSEVKVGSFPEEADKKDRSKITSSTIISRVVGKKI